MDPRQQAPDADAKVDQGEVDPEVALPDGRGHDGPDHGVEARPEDATRRAEQAQSHRGHHRRGGEGEQYVAEHLRRHAGEDDASGAEPVDEGAGGSDNGHTDDGRHRQQAAGGLDREAADLIEIDEAKRQHEPRAQCLDGHSGQQELAIARQVVPERRQGRAFTCGGGHRPQYGQATHRPRGADRVRAVLGPVRE